MRAPINASTAKRPDFETAPVTRLEPKVADSLKKSASELVRNKKEEADSSNSQTPTGQQVAVGEECKNGGCKAVYTALQNIYKFIEYTV